MESNLEISDMKLIIRNLITFIVVDGKEYVNDKHKREYVSDYVQVLAKTIHLIDEKKDVTIVEDIADDITKYLE